MTWLLIKKAETQARKPFRCADCETELPAGSYVKRFTFKKDDQYVHKRICEDCEKYYRNKDFKIK